MDPQTAEPSSPQPVPETPAPEPTSTPAPVEAPTPPPAAPAPPAAVAALPPVPDTWPGAFGVYKYSKQAVKVNVLTILVVGLIFIVLEGGIDAKTGSSNGGGSLLSFLISSLGSVTLASVYLSGIKGQKVSIGESFKNGLPFWLKGIGLNFLVTAATILSLLLLIIPFFFVFPRLSLATYFLVDRKLGVMDAFKASWDETKGHLTKVWGIIGATFLMVLLMVTIIGIPFSIYFLLMYSAASAVLYQYITKNPATPTASVQSAAPVQAPPAAV